MLSQNVTNITVRKNLHLCTNKYILSDLLMKKYLFREFAMYAANACFVKFLNKS